MEGQPRALSLAESSDRARLIVVSSYEVDLDLTRGAEVFRSRTVARFSCASPGAATFIEVRAARLVSATLNGRLLDDGQLRANRLTLPTLQADNELVVEADMPYASTGEGMHRFTDPVDAETYVGAYLGVDNAQRIFANFDQPDLKAPIAAAVTAPVGWTVVSNMRPRGVPTDEGRWEFATTPPLSTYLFAMVAGRLHTVRAEHRGTPFALHCRRSLAGQLDAEAPEILAITHACFDRYAEIFDEPYPFDSYDQAFVPELNWGALESPGCVTLRDEFVYPFAVTEAERLYRGMVIAHEMAHMWFGDLVTMRWWDDIWLSESFAEYMGFKVLSEATRFTGTWTAFAMANKTRGYDADQRPTTHPVAPPAADVADTETALANFDGISYAKGASALRQLAAWLGEAAFLAGVNDFLGRHRFGVGTLADLLDSLGTASGLDVHRWADSWLRTTGVDTLRVIRGDEGRPDGLRVEHPGLRSHRVGLGLYDRASDDPTRLVLRRRTLLTLAEGSSSTPVELAEREPRPDLLLLNDGDESYAKIRLDASSLAWAVDGLATIADPLSRAVVWTALRDLVRDGELAPIDYLTVVGRQLPTEDDLSIVGGVLGFARHHVIDRYLDPAARTTALSDMGRTGQAILERTEHAPVSGLRLAAVRAVIDAAGTVQGARALRGWLTADTVPGGPALDADLRWRILLRLAVLDAVEPGEVAAELARDRSGAGPEGAARCASALPTLAAKNAAWEAMFGAGQDGDLPSTYLVTATAQGFWQPEQRELLAPFVTRYFPAVVQVSARRGAWVAAAVASSGFPFHDVDDATLRAAAQGLAGGAGTATLQRQLADQLDEFRRALRVRRREPSGPRIGCAPCPS